MLHLHQPVASSLSLRTAGVIRLGSRVVGPNGSNRVPSIRLVSVNDVTTIADQLAAALRAYEELVSLAEDIDDEWTYVTDLSAAWGERLESVIEERGDEPLGVLEQAALERVADEIGRISDPHRAIDWLSTFPHIVLTVVGERA